MNLIAPIERRGFDPLRGDLLLWTRSDRALDRARARAIDRGCRQVVTMVPWDSELHFHTCEFDEHSEYDRARLWLIQDR